MRWLVQCCKAKTWLKNIYFSSSCRSTISLMMLPASLKVSLSTWPLWGSADSNQFTGSVGRWIIQWIDSSSGSVTGVHARTPSLCHGHHLDVKPCGISNKWHLIDICDENLWSQKFGESEKSNGVLMESCLLAGLFIQHLLVSRKPRTMLSPKCWALSLWSLECDGGVKQWIQVIDG